MVAGQRIRGRRLTGTSRCRSLRAASCSDSSPASTPSRARRHGPPTFTCRERRSSMTFDAIFVPDAMRAVVDDRAWLQAMLDAEAALARAQARARVIPAEAADAVAAICDAARYDVEHLARDARSAGNP